MFSNHRASAYSALLAFCTAASAQTNPSLHGLVLDPLGARVPSAHIELLAMDAANTVVAQTTSASDGSYSFNVPSTQRFRLRFAAPTFSTTLTTPLLLSAGGSSTHNLTFGTPTYSEQVTVTATGTPTPLAQSGSPISILEQQQLPESLLIQETLTLIPGVQTTTNGQAGGATSLFLRGGNSEFTKTLLDGVPVNDLGAGADLSTLLADGIGRVEILRQPTSVLYGSDLTSGVVSLSTPRGTTPLPLFTYSVDGGNFATLHQSVSIAGARTHVDYLSGFAVLQTANQTPNDQFRDATTYGNYGYQPDARTDVRFIFRHIKTNSGVPNSIALYGVSDLENQFYSETFLSGTAQQQTSPRWHNLIRYGRESLNYTLTQYAPAGTPNPDLGETVGNVVTITGANGYTTSGQAQLDYIGSEPYLQMFPNTSIRTARRGFLYSQSDYHVTDHLNILGAFQYEAEKGKSSYATVSRGNYSGTIQVAGDVRNRLFYVLGSGVEANEVYGKAITPRASLAYYAVRPFANHFLSGTKLHASFGKGVEEPSVGDQVSSLYGIFQTLPNGPALINQYNVKPLGGEYSRTYDVGIEQQFGDGRARINLSWYHNQFTNVLEYVPPAGLLLIGVAPPIANNPDLYGAYVNSEAYRAEGAELESEIRLSHSFFLRAGYNYLDAVVQRSFSSDALGPNFNTTSNFSTLPIGNYSPLIGARPFRRAPHSGYFTLQYNRARLNTQITGTLVGRRDDSTYLGGFDVSYGNSLLLPNRNLDGAYQRLELSTTYRINAHISTYVDLQNLLNQSYFEAFGYPALPFTVRGGLRLNFGGESFRLR